MIFMYETTVIKISKNTKYVSDKEQKKGIK